MSGMTMQFAPVADVKRAEGHVASLRLPIGCMALTPLTRALEKAYGKGLVLREEPKGWLHIETPDARVTGAGAMTRARGVVCSDGIHCGDCPHLKPYGEKNDLTAKCDLTGSDLMWHDYWLAECDTSNKKVEAPK